MKVIALKFDEILFTKVEAIRLLFADPVKIVPSEVQL